MIFKKGVAQLSHLKIVNRTSKERFVQIRENVFAERFCKALRVRLLWVVMQWPIRLWCAI